MAGFNINRYTTITAMDKAVKDLKLLKRITPILTKAKLTSKLKKLIRLKLSF